LEMKPTKALLSIIIICAIGLATVLYAVHMRGQVAKYKNRAEVMETAFNRLQKLTPITDGSNYPAVGKVAK